MRLRTLIALRRLALPALLIVASGCADKTAARDLSSGDGGEGQTTEGNLLAAEPELLLVTTKALREAWLPYAEHRTLAGVHTRVVTIEEVTANRSAADPAAALREELAARFAAGSLRFVLLGGDAELVPFRRVEGHYSIPAIGDYASNGPAELYFAEPETNWDKDGNSLYGESSDLSLEELRAPKLAVGRVPVSHAEEVQAYLDKVHRYEFEPSGRATYPLLLSDVALQVPVVGEIDGAEAIEATLQAVFPEVFRSHARRLYATDKAASRFGGEKLTSDGVQAALEEGYLLAFHTGHANYDALTGALSSGFVDALSNQLPPVWASTGCLAGNFVDVANAPDFHNWSAQGADDDSAGERFIRNPHGGVAYLGNTGVGLGALGGSQFLHAFFQALFGGARHVGAAFLEAHAKLRSVSLSITPLFIPLPLVMEDGSEFWTHMGVILLGDPALPVWTDEPRALKIEVPASYHSGLNELVITVRDVDGATFAGATVTALKADDFLLQATTDEAGRVTLRFVPRGSGVLKVQVSGPNLLPGRVELAPADPR